MATPIKIKVDVDMDGVIDQAKRGGDALEDMGDAFGDVEDASTAAARTTQRSLDDMVDSFDDVADAGQTAASGASEIGKIGPAADSVKGSLGDLGNVAQDVLSGDFASGATGAIDAIAGIASSIPGVGTAVGILAGLFTSMFAAAQADAAATEQRISDMYDDMVASGERFASSQFVQKAISDITGDQGKYNQALETSRQLGVSVNDVILAMAGDQGTINGLMDQQNAKRQAEIDAINSSGDSLENNAVKIDGVNAKYGTMLDAVNEVASANDSAGKRFDAYQSASSQYFQGLIDSAGSAEIEIDELGNKLVTLEGGTQVLIEAETGVATGNIKKFQGDVDGIKDKTMNVKAALDDSAVRGYRPPTLRGTIIYSAQVGAAGANPDIWK